MSIGRAGSKMSLCPKEDSSFLWLSSKEVGSFPLLSLTEVEFYDGFFGFIKNQLEKKNSFD